MFSHNSDDATSDDRSAGPPPNNSANGSPPATLRRPRGRPPGSKNKPKPPIIFTKDSAEDDISPAAMRPYVLEVAAGEDIVGTLARFSRRRNLGLSLISGTGAVSDVALQSGGSLSFPGVFEILSISATFFPPSFSPPASSALPRAAVILGGPNGQVFGGLVASPLRAAVSVTLLAAVFSSPSYLRLPAEEEISSPTTSSPPPAKVRRLQSEAIWGAGARSPPY